MHVKKSMEVKKDEKLLSQKVKVKTQFITKRDFPYDSKLHGEKHKTLVQI